MLQVVEQGCTFNADNTRATIIVESDITDNFGMAIEELSSAEARNVALAYAGKRGVGSPCINGSPSGAYPINAKGLSLESVRGPQGEALPATHPQMQVARYRIDVPVAQRF